MRGGDRLVNECSWMSGICFSFYHSTYCCGDFKRSPPLISLFCQSVPKCRLPKNPASPRGKPRSASPLAVHKLLVRTVYYSQRVRSSKCFLKSLCCGRMLSAPTVPGAKRRAGRLLVDPLGAYTKPVTGLVRAPTYSYYLRSVIVRRHCRPPPVDSLLKNRYNDKYF